MRVDLKIEGEVALRMTWRSMRACVRRFPSIAAVILTLSIVASAQTVLRFPRVVSGSETYTGIAVSNPTPEAATVTLTAYTPEGSVWTGAGISNPETVTVPAGGQLARLTREVFGSGEFNGWVRATSSTAGLTGFFLNGNFAGSDLDGAEAGSAETELILPLVEVNAPTVTELTVVNPNETGAAVELTAYGSDGTVLGVVNLGLAARALIRQRVETVFAGLAISGASHVRVRSDVPVVGFGLVADFVAGGQARETAATMGRRLGAGPAYIVPHFASGGGWLSLLGVVNGSGVNQSVTITVYGNDGELAQLGENPKTIELAGNGSLRTTVGELFELDPAVLETGWLKLEATVGFLIPYVGYGVVGAPSFALVAGTQTGAASRYQTYAQVAEGAGLFTGLTVVNPGSNPATIDVVVMRPDGTTVGTTQVTLAAGNKSAQLLREFIAASLEEVGGWVFLRSTEPVLGAVVFGSRSGRALAQVPQLDAGGDFLAPVQQSAAITGSVREGVNPVAGVTMTLSGPVNAGTETDSEGRYIFSRLPAGSYGVSAARRGAVISPSQRGVDLGPANLGGVDFELGGLGVANPPAVSLITPVSTFTGGAGINLRVFGTGFTPVSIVEIDGRAVPTTFVSSVELTATIPADELAELGNRQVVVVTSPPGGGRSDQVGFAVNSVPSNPLIVGRVGVGAFPAGVAIDGARSRALITNESSDSVSVVELDPLRLAGSVNVGRSPAEGIAIDSQRDRALVANVGSDSVSVIDLEQDAQVATINVGSFPLGVAVDEFGGRILVVNGEDDTVSVIDAGSSAEVGTIPVGSRPGGIAVDPIRALAVVTNRGDNTVTLIELGSLTPVSTIAVGAFPRAVAINAGTGLAVVTNAGAGSVSVIDLGTPTTAPVEIQVGTGPSGVAIHEITNTAIVTNSGVVGEETSPGTATVSIINLDRLEVTQTVEVGAAAFGVDIDQDRQIAVVANFGSNDVTVLRVPNPTPAVTDFEPRTFPAGGGGFTLTVRGSGFLPTSVVTLNGQALGTTFISTTELRAEVTADVLDQILFVQQIALDGGADPITRRIQVPINVGVSNPAPGGGASPPPASGGQIQAENAVPILESINPMQVGVDDGVFVLTVNGNNFNASSEIRVGAMAFPPDTVAPLTMTVSLTSTQLGVGPAPVSVFNPAPGGGNSASFTLDVIAAPPPAPQVSAVTPASVLAGSPDLLLLIDGSGFQIDTGVSVDGQTLAVTSQTATVIEALVPASVLASPATLNGLVDTPEGGTAAFSFNVINPIPLPTGFAPQSTPVGTESLGFEVSGSEFGPDAMIEVGGTGLPTIVSGPNLLQTTIPGSFFLAEVSLEIAVNNPGAPRAVVGFFDVLPFVVPEPAPLPMAPDITGLSPATVTEGQASSLTVTGTDLADVNATIDTLGATITSQSETLLLVDVPPLTPGFHTLTVTGPGGADSAQFEVIPIPAPQPVPPTIPAPTITSINPTSVTSGASFSIEAFGTGLANVTATIDGSQESISSQSATSLMVSGSPLTAGTHTLTVSGPGGSASFSFQAVASPPPLLPTLTTMAPNTGIQGNTVDITLTGTHFDQPNAMVLFSGGVSVSSVTVVSPTQIDARVALTSLGINFVRVMTDAGTSGAQTFTINANILQGATAFSSTTPFGMVNVSGFIDGIGNAAQFDDPQGISLYAPGFLAVSENGDNIRTIETATRQVRTLAGNSSSGSTDGIGTAAQFNGPRGIWFDGVYLFVADRDNHVIRRIEELTGQVTTVAGQAGLSGLVDGVGTAARFYEPVGIWGNAKYLFVADSVNNVIRRIDRATWQVTTFAGNPGGLGGFSDAVGPSALFFDPNRIYGSASTLYVADDGNYLLRKVDLQTASVTTLAGIPGTQAILDGPQGVGTFSSLRGVWFDGTHVYLTDDDAVRRVDLTGTLETLAGSSNSGTADGIGAAAGFNDPRDLFSDGSKFWLADSDNDTIRVLTPVLAPAQTWVGGASGLENDWSEPTNWSPVGVPSTLSDVTIPSGLTFYPILNLAVSVHDLTVAVGANLDTSGHTITASGNVSAGNTISGPGVVEMTGTGTTLSGTLPGLIVSGTVTLGAATVVTGDLLVTGTGASLTVGGQMITVQLNLSIEADAVLIMQNPADQVVLMGNATFDGGPSVGLLTEGTITAHGNFTEGGFSATSFAATLNHTVVFMGSGTQSVMMTGPGLTGSRFQDVQINGPVSFDTAVQINGNLTVLGTGMLSGTGTATVEGNATTAVGTNVTISTFSVVGSLTAGGTFSPSTTNFRGTGPQSIPSAPAYNHVTIFGSAQFVGTTTIGGNLTAFLSGAPQTINMNGQSVTVMGNFDTSGFFIMQNPADLLIVHGDVDFKGSSFNGGNATAGTIEVKGDFSVCCSKNIFAASGSHKVVFNRTTLPSQTVGIFPGGPSDGNFFNDVEFDSAVGVRITAAAPINGNATITSGTVTGTSPASVTIGGNLVDNAGPNAWQFMGPTTFTGSPALPSNLTGTFTFGGAAVLGADVTFNGDVTVSGGGASLDIGGFAVTVKGNFVTTSSGRLMMQAGTGSLAVTGNVDSAGGSSPSGSMTAGTLKIGGNFSNTGSFDPTGSHVTEFNGSAVQTLTNPQATSNTFQDVILANAAGLLLATPIYIDGQLQADLVGGLPPLISNGGGNILSTVSLDVSALILDNVRLIMGILDPTGSLTQFDNVTFRNYPTTLTRFEVHNPGTAGPFTLNNLNFSGDPEPTTGFYVSATDTNPIDSALQLDLVGSSGTTNPVAHTSTSGGAIVNWSNLLPTITSISPTSGVQGGTFPVTIMGTNFTGGSVAVSGGGVVIPSVNVVNSTQIDALFVLSGPASARNLTVTNNAGTSAPATFTIGASDVVTTIPFNTRTPLAGHPGFGSVDGTNASARFNFPTGSWSDGTYLYITDTGNRTIRRYEFANGQVTTIAGSPGVAGCVDAVGAAASFIVPRDVWGDGAGNLYITDVQCRTIRKIVLATQTVSTLAGLSQVPASLDGPTGLSSRFAAPQGIWGDNSIDLYVSDQGAVRRVRRDTGQTTTIAGAGGVSGTLDGVGTSARFSLSLLGITGLDGGTGSGTLWVADAGSHTIRQIDIASLAVTTLAGSPGVLGTTDGIGGGALFSSPWGIWYDPARGLFVSDASSVLRNITTPGGVVTTVAGSTATLDYVDAVGTSARFDSPRLLWGDGTNLFIVGGNHAIRQLALASNAVSTLAGSPIPNSGIADGTGVAAEFNLPQSAWGDGMGNLYIADTVNHTIRRMVIATGATTTFAGTATVSGALDGIGTAAQFNQPEGIWGDGVNLYVADRGNHTIRQINLATMQVTTLAGSAGLTGTSNGVGAAARFNTPHALWSDGVNVFVADRDNHTIRQIVLATAQVTTISGAAGFPGHLDHTVGVFALFDTPLGIWGDGANLYVSEGGLFAGKGHTIRKMDLATGAVTTLAGTPGTVGSTDGTGALAGFNFPHGVWGDGTNLYIADHGNHLVRKVVIATGVVTTIAGAPGIAGSGADSRSLNLNLPMALWGDGSTLFLVDGGNQQIRKIDPQLE